MATTKYKVVKCDECNHEFKLKPKIMQVKNMNNDKSVQMYYFECPKCKHRYIVMYQDQEYKGNLKEMEIIRKKASELRYSDERYLRLLDQHNWYRERNLGISNQYKRVYGS